MRCVQNFSHVNGKWYKWQNWEKLSCEIRSKRLSSKFFEKFLINKLRIDCFIFGMKQKFELELELLESEVVDALEDLCAAALRTFKRWDYFMERGIIFTFRKGTILLVDISLPSCTGKMTQHVIFCRLRVNITQHAAVTELRKKNT